MILCRTHWIVIMDQQEPEADRSKRQVKMTEKAVDEARNKLIQQRRSKLAQLTGKRREIESITIALLHKN